jgi:hypothetical protein
MSGYLFQSAIVRSHSPAARADSLMLEQIRLRPLHIYLLHAANSFVTM